MADRPNGGPGGSLAVEFLTRGVRHLVGAFARPSLLALLDFDAFFGPVPVVETVSFPAAGDALDAAVFQETPGAHSSNPPGDVGADEHWDLSDAGAYAGIRDEEEDAWLGGATVEKEAARRRLADLLDEVRDAPAAVFRAAAVVAPAVGLPRALAARCPLSLCLPPDPFQVRELLNEEGDAAALGETEAQLVWHAAGLTRGQVRDSLRLSRIDHGGLTPACLEQLLTDKRQIIRGEGLLELVRPPCALEDLVGLDLLKRWFAVVRRAVRGPVALGALPPPRGLLLGGMPGCGKSLAAQAMAGSLGWPLLRLDMSRLFGAFLGDAERNTRNALAMAEAMSPAVLWIDEVEKGLNPAATPSEARVYHTLLRWMNDRTACVYVTATANDGAAAPVEFARAGRLDGCFFEFPGAGERGELIRLALAAHGRDPAVHDFADLAAETAGRSCADLAGRWTSRTTACWPSGPSGTRGR